MSIKNNTTLLNSLLEQANNLPDAGGVELPELTNEATASDLMSGKELINSEGNKITGTFTIDTELATQDNLIAQITNAVNNLPEAGNGGDNADYTISVTLIDNLGMNGIFYFDTNSTLQSVNNSTQTVDALFGIVFTKTPTEFINASGNYIQSEGVSVKAVRFLEDGGIAIVQ